MAKLCPLFSSSEGNCTYISTGKTGFLVDAGVSAKRILTALEAGGIDKENVKGIFITHEHSDHINGLRVLLKKLKVPVFASKKTLTAVFEKGAFDESTQVCPIEDETELLGVHIKRFATSHDCEGSSGYRFDLNTDLSVAVCTDTGIITPDIKQALMGCRGVLIESNHDIKMLKNGPYPYELKLRVGSDHGHLSNNACAALLPELLDGGTTRIILGHLSQNNNRPDLALSCAQAALMDIGAKRDEDYLLSCAGPLGGGELGL